MAITSSSFAGLLGQAAFTGSERYYRQDQAPRYFGDFYNYDTTQHVTMAQLGVSHQTNKHRVKTNLGEIEFKAEKFPSCCGICVIHEFHFNLKSPIFGNIEHAYKELMDYIINSDNRELNRALLMISATKGSQLDEFCKTTGWTESVQPYHNPLSGNNVIVYTKQK